MLRMYVNEDQDNWDEILSLVTYSYNTGIRSSTGFCPFEILFGHKPRLPIDLLLVPPSAELSSAPELEQKLANRIRKIQTIAGKVNKTSQAKMKERYDAKTRPISFKQGDLVLRKIQRYEPGTSRKLSACWDGPHRVVYAPRDSPTVIIHLFDDPDGAHDKLNVMLLKKYTERPGVATISFSSF